MSVENYLGEILKIVIDEVDLFLQSSQKIQQSTYNISNQFPPPGMIIFYFDSHDDNLDYKKFIRSWTYK